MPSAEDRELIRENLRLKREIEMLVRDRQSVETAFAQLRDETRLEFQSIQKEFHRLTNELSNSHTSTEHVDVQLNRCYKLIEQLLEELKTEKLRSQALIAEKEKTIQQLRDDLTYWSAASETKSNRRSSSAHNRSRSHSSSALPPPRSSRQDFSASAARTRRSVSQDSLASHQRRSGYLADTAASAARRLSSQSPMRQSTRAPSSSPYKRFDPTAYVREKQERTRQRTHSNNSQTSLNRARSLSRDSLHDSLRGGSRERVSNYRPPHLLSDTSLNSTVTPRQYKTLVQPTISSRPSAGKKQKAAVPLPPLKQKQTTPASNSSAKQVDQLAKSLRSVEANDIDARLSVLQSYFERIRG